MPNRTVYINRKNDERLKTLGPTQTVGGLINRLLEEYFDGPLNTQMKKVQKIYSEVSDIDPKELETVKVPAGLVQSTPVSKNRLAIAKTPEQAEEQIKKVQEDLMKGSGKQEYKFCANGHAIPAGRSKCMGKGCKYA